MGNRSSGLVLASLVLGFTLLAPSLATADSDAAQAAFDKANAAFRNQDYAGALAGYNEALNLGKDSRGPGRCSLVELLDSLLERIH